MSASAARALSVKEDETIKNETSPRNKKFTPGELQFIRERTWDAKPGEWMTARVLATCPELKRHSYDGIKCAITRLRHQHGYPPRKPKAVESPKEVEVSEDVSLEQILPDLLEFYLAEDRILDGTIADRIVG